MSSSNHQHNVVLSLQSLSVFGIIFLVAPIASDAEESSYPTPEVVFTWWNLAETLGALVVVLTVFLVCVFFYKRYYQGMHVQSRHVTVLGSINVGSKEKLVVVRFAGQEMLLGVTQSTISRLSASASDSVDIHCGPGVISENE